MGTTIYAGGNGGFGSPSGLNYEDGGGGGGGAAGPHGAGGNGGTRSMPAQHQQDGGPRLPVLPFTAAPARRRGHAT